jgi:hypothetical protein
VAQIPKLTKEQWAEVRSRYEAGEVVRHLAREYGVSHTAIILRAQSGGWVRDQEEAIRRRTLAKVTQTQTPRDQDALDRAVEAEAERRAAVLRRHREETTAARSLLYDATKAVKEAKTATELSHGEKRMRSAKAAAETLAKLHDVERRAWGFDEDKAGNAGAAQASVELHVHYQS